MEVYEAAIGNCVVCGTNVEGSLYWTPLPAEIWEIVRPHLAPMFPKDMVQNVLFIKPHSKPFCGPVCATKYHQENP